MPQIFGPSLFGIQEFHILNNSVPKVLIVGSTYYPCNFREVEYYYRMSLKFTSTTKKEGNYFVARCAPLGVVSQGKTLDEANANLKEAVELYLEA